MTSMPARAKLVTKKDFAAVIGVTPARVSQLLKAGLPVRQDGLIHLAPARRWYEKRFPRRDPLPLANDNAKSPTTPSLASVAAGSNGHASSLLDEGADYAVSRAERERAQAGIRNLEAGEDDA